MVRTAPRYGHADRGRRSTVSNPEDVVAGGPAYHRAMPLVVQKFGGTSVADADRIRNVARRVVETHKAGNQVVSVVSAMGKGTDELLSLASEVSVTTHPRELDMLLTAGERITMSLVAMAIQDLGVPAMSLTGSQAGILTTGRHGQAEIVEIRARVKGFLKSVDFHAGEVQGRYEGKGGRITVDSAACRSASTCPASRATSSASRSATAPTTPRSTRSRACSPCPSPARSASSRFSRFIELGKDLFIEVKLFVV